MGGSLVPRVVKEASSAVVQFPPHGRDQERVVSLPVPPIVEEIEAIMQATPHVRDQGHSFQQSVTGPHTPGAIIGPLFPCGAVRVGLGTELQAADHEAPAGRPGQPPSETQMRRAQRRAQYQRLKYGPAWQTARQVRKVLSEFPKALHQAQGRSFKTTNSLP